MSEHDYAFATVAAAVAARETPAAAARHGRFLEWITWKREARRAATRAGYALGDHAVLVLFLEAAGDDCLAWITIDEIMVQSCVGRSKACQALRRLVDAGELIPTGEFRGRTPVYAVRRRAEIASDDIRAKVHLMDCERERESPSGGPSQSTTWTLRRAQRACQSPPRGCESPRGGPQSPRGGLPDLETKKPKKQETANAVSPARAQAHRQARGEPDWVSHLVPGNYDLSHIEPALTPAAVSVSFGLAEAAPADRGAEAELDARIAAAVKKRNVPILASAAEQRAAEAEVERLRAEVERLRTEVERRAAEPAPADPPPSPAPEFALEPPADAAAKPKRRRKAAEPGAGERLDPAWRPTGDLREWTLREVPTPQDAADELAKFREYYLEGKGRNQRRKLSGWELCWRNWIKTALPTLARYERAKRELEANKNGGTVHYLSKAEQHERRYKEAVQRNFERARALDEADAVAAAASGVGGADHSSGGGGSLARLETGARNTVNIC